MCVLCLRLPLKKKKKQKKPNQFKNINNGEKKELKIEIVFRAYLITFTFSVQNKLIGNISASTTMSYSDFMVLTVRLLSVPPNITKGSAELSSAS